ncbi:hypothetical protein PILCRDRAFT_3218 [Piloderma croceum F 1598]|uniref:Uncharacterized protein n=1 Tax=Piloderma croceum (strain F 1598) TaxID=765440 RepID=A0A0C3BNY8_PILCF|nr:hypothetical protein PILCRDRAFT_3218 [Piloderma croceum F 1598]
MDSIPASPQQILARRNLLNVLLSSFDVILEFDPTTGGLKNWAWPRSKQFRWGRLPLAYFVGHRATNWLVFPCCLCAPLQGDVVESAVYIAATGPYRGFWVAGCAQDQCEYFVPLERFFNKGNILEREYPSRTPDPVRHVRDSAPMYKPERYGTPGLLDMISPHPLVMPQYEVPHSMELSVDDLIRRLDTWPRPGIPVEQFLELYAYPQ